ncbi:protein DENND6A [Caerostris extrusa]|uniref:Protein DENND6A n=1 Tax=Caerostris extrusa TaxID=172846 RepID=A0AAV4QHB4_CAEEX|nr:protein DENND6A [Caerostris extrusa]
MGQVLSLGFYCICVVTFDLELGQAMEMIYPAHIKLTEKEKSSICYMAFPDSNSGCMGNTQFYFRMRQCPARKPNLPAHEEFNKHCLVPLQHDKVLCCVRPVDDVHPSQSMNICHEVLFIMQFIICRDILSSDALMLPLIPITAVIRVGKGKNCLTHLCHSASTMKFCY